MVNRLDNLSGGADVWRGSRRRRWWPSTKRWKPCGRPAG